MVDKPVETLPSAREESTALLDGDGEPAAVERTLAAVLASVVRTEHVPVDSHFFDDLGADSLVMAHFCARVRKRGDLPSVSMKDVYRHPTIRDLATALTDDQPLPQADPEAAAPTAESARLAIALDRAVDIKDITRHPVLADLARVLDDGSPAAVPPASATAGPAPPTSP